MTPLETAPPLSLSLTFHTRSSYLIDGRKIAQHVVAGPVQHMYQDAATGHVAQECQAQPHLISYSNG